MKMDLFNTTKALDWIMNLDSETIPFCRSIWPKKKDTGLDTNWITRCSTLKECDQGILPQADLGLLSPPSKTRITLFPSRPRITLSPSISWTSPSQEDHPWHFSFLCLFIKLFEAFLLNSYSYFFIYLNLKKWIWQDFVTVIWKNL